MPFFNPHPYQLKGIEFLVKNPRAMLAWDMGLGKTATVGQALCDLLDIEQVSNALIVAPLRVAIQWEKELAKWGNFKHLRIELAIGTKARRERALATPADIHIINYDNLVWLIEQYGATWQWDCVVFDESSKLKSSSTARWKAAKRMVGAKRPAVILLSGTPAPNSLLDLWPQVYLMDQGQRLGKSMTRYKTRYFTSDFMGYTWTLNPGAKEEIEGAISDIVHALKSEDYLDLPEYIHNVITVQMPKGKVTEDYHTLERDLYLDLAAKDTVITAGSAAIVTNKCIQYANGAVYDENHSWHEVHTAKLEALEDVIEEAAGAPVLVAYHFQSDMIRILERFPKAQVLDKPHTIDEWNRGQIPILLAHPASAGMGLNLQEGGHIIVWFGLPWSLENYLQFNARLYRQGQTKPVFVHHLVTEGTLDDVVLDRLASKATVQQSLLDALKERNP